jgi:hypothetical protein
MTVSKTPRPQPRPSTARKVAKAICDAKVRDRGETTLRVRTAVLPGGYRVFGAPVEPEHTTRERIAAAVAAQARSNRRP